MDRDNLPPLESHFGRSLRQFRHQCDDALRGKPSPIGTGFWLVIAAIIVGGLRVWIEHSTQIYPKSTAFATSVCMFVAFAAGAVHYYNHRHFGEDFKGDLVWMGWVPAFLISTSLFYSTLHPVPTAIAPDLDSEVCWEGQIRRVDYQSHEFRLRLTSQEEKGVRQFVLDKEDDRTFILLPEAPITMMDDQNHHLTLRDLDLGSKVIVVGKKRKSLPSVVEARMVALKAEPEHQ